MGMSIAFGPEPPWDDWTQVSLWRLPDPSMVNQRGREMGMLWHVPGRRRRRRLAGRTRGG